MKKILYFILCITTMFVLVSCKKNEPVGRETANFLSDFKFESTDDYNQFDAICKDMNTINRVSNFKTTIRTIEFNFTTTKKVVIKKISFRLYNYSKTETLKIMVNNDNIYNFNDLGCTINYFDESVGFEVEDIEPSGFKDITLEFGGLVLKKKTNVKLLFGYTLNASHYGIDMETATIEDRKMPANRLKNCAGISNFKVDYIAYIKV